jgi:hypothetical protein
MSRSRSNAGDTLAGAPRRCDAAPGRGRREEAFSWTVCLTRDEVAGMAEVMRALIAQ